MVDIKTRAIQKQKVGLQKEVMQLQAELANLRRQLKTATELNNLQQAYIQVW